MIAYTLQNRSLLFINQKIIKDEPQHTLREGYAPSILP